MRTKCRIPTLYFVTSGAGQSSAETGSDHYETSAYDMALLDGGIENFNVMTYTSVLPPEAKEIKLEQAKKLGLVHHGAVLETIKAQMEGVEGEHLCAGIGTCQVYVVDDDGNREHLGGFAAEYEGHGSKEKAKAILKKDLEGIVERRYKGDPRTFDIVDVTYYTRDIIVDAAYGLVYVALCFVEYEYPEV